MQQKFSLIKGNSEDIGFASTCLVAGVISFDEFKQWLYLVIEQEDELPDYIFDILDIENKFDYTLKMREIIGFHANWEGSEPAQSLALDGIAYKRDADYVSDAVSREQALTALQTHPEVEVKFKALFPFITV